MKRTDKDESFLCQCLVDTLEGLRDGLSHFCGPSRVSVIFAIKPEAPVRVFDPQNLLDGHEPRFKELFLESTGWRMKDTHCFSGFRQMEVEKDLGLAGLVSCAGYSATLFYQAWFTEHHPDMCSTGPVECWLEHAAWRFAHDIANKKELYTGISGAFLREYAIYAVRDHIVDEMNRLLGMDCQIRIFSVLDSILGISRTREERAWPRGRLVFIEPKRLSSVDFMIRFSDYERPDITNYKHVRKLLLSVENSDRFLVSDGAYLVGIARSTIPDVAIVADFRGGHGFIMLDENQICSFSNGAYLATTHRAKLVQVEEALLESRLSPDEAGNLFSIISRLVHNAQSEKHGCTLVIDLREEPVIIPGQRLTDPLDLNDHENLRLAESLTKVDGALHIGSDKKLYGFACLLDGRAVPGEDRSRGARYNSALRFSSENPGILVVVVSVDRGVSVLQDGGEISAKCRFSPLSCSITMPPLLEEWISAKEG